MNFYEEALRYITPSDIVIDGGCGNGAGTLLLSGRAKKVVGIDRDRKLIRFASEHHKAPNNYYMVNNLDQMEAFPQCDVFVLISVIEELRYQTSVLGKIQQATRKKIIIASILDVSRMIEHEAWVRTVINQSGDMFSFMVYERK